VQVREISSKEALVKMLDELPPEQVTQILDFATFIRERLQYHRINYQAGIRAVPATHLDSLVGGVAWGGDALTETEDLYKDDQASSH